VHIIADNFSLQAIGYRKWLTLRNDGDVTESAVQQKFKEALRGFPW
jgi:hypothetical protein